jgi:hypothetical protein
MAGEYRATYVQNPAYVARYFPLRLPLRSNERITKKKNRKKQQEKIARKNTFFWPSVAGNILFSFFFDFSFW